MLVFPLQKLVFTKILPKKTKKKLVIDMIFHGFGFQKLMGTKTVILIYITYNKHII